MSDQDTPIATLKQDIQAFAEARDWQQFHSPKNLSMAIAAEAAELMELFLWCQAETSVELAAEEKRQEVCEELADIVIYCLELANVTGIDITDAIRAKMDRNQAKYPVEKSRGSYRKYSEL